MAEKIKKIVLASGVELDATALEFVGINSSGNLEITSPVSKKLNLLPSDNLQVKPGGKIQLDTNLRSGGKDKFEMSVIKDKKNKVEGLKIECAGVIFETKNADSGEGWDQKTFKQMYKIEGGSTDTWAKANLHAASFDFRTRVTGPGTGGGIAVQIASCDSDFKENKFKIESSRKVDAITGGLPSSSSEWANYYVNEGGKGIEIGTINSQFESIYTKSMRRGADTEVYAVDRSEVIYNDGKYDYNTQADDSKDIIPNDHPVGITWRDLINAAAYLKAQGLIPNDGSFYTAG